MLLLLGKFQSLSIAVLPMERGSPYFTALTDVAVGTMALLQV